MQSVLQTEYLHSVDAVSPSASLGRTLETCSGCTMGANGPKGTSDLKGATKGLDEHEVLARAWE